MISGRRAGQAHLALEGAGDALFVHDTEQQLLERLAAEERHQRPRALGGSSVRANERAPKYKDAD